MGESTLNNNLSWYESVLNFVNNIFLDEVDEIIEESTDANLKLIVPANIVYRSELICEYISKQIGHEFCIYDLILLLYKDFINSNILKYDTLKMLRELTKDHDEVIKLKIGDKVLEHKKECNRKLVIITVPKKDTLSGELLLEELKDIYGKEISLEKMFCNIWINFIEQYKRGENQEILNNIIEIIKEQHN